MNIVTGYTGSAHVTSNAAQALNQGIFGTGNGVLDIGNKFAATLADANTVTIQDGEGIMQGVHFRIDPGDTEDVTISNGTSGYYRIDLICARYTKNASTGVEDVSLVVIEGTPDASSATAPSYNTGDIRDGDSPVDFPLYQVSLNGLTPTLTAIFGGAAPSGGVLLWENPDANYGSLSASLDLTGYDYIDVVFKYYNSAYQEYFVQKTERYPVANVMHSSAEYLYISSASSILRAYYRSVEAEYISANRYDVTFGVSYWADYSGGTWSFGSGVSVLLPYRIYGGKY